MPDEPRPARALDEPQEILEERIAHLERLKSFQDELVKVIRIFTSNESFTSERCLQEIVNFIGRKFDIQITSVLLLDDVSRELVLYVAGGEAPPAVAAKAFRIPIDAGLTGHCARTGETVVANDVSRDARYFPGPYPQIQSEMCVPIRIKQRIVGVLDLQDARRDRFRKEFAQAMEDLSLNLGFVLETKQLYDDLKRSNELLERKVEERVRQLKNSEERYRAIVENAVDPIFMTDPQGHLTWANRATSNHLGYPADELVGMNLSRIVKKGYMHKLYLSLRECLEGREVKPIQIEVITKAGEERTVEFSCSGVRENGRATGVEAALRDITDRVVIDKLKKNYMRSLEDAVVERTSEIKETQRAAILAIANLAESIDDDTGGHLQRIRHYCKVDRKSTRLNSSN